MKLKLFIACLLAPIWCFSQAEELQLSRQLLRQAGSKSMVGFGEEGHGFESLNKAKSMMLVYFHDSLNFRSVLFESSFTLATISYLQGESLHERMKRTLYPFWNTSSVMQSIEVFHREERAGKVPHIFGIDVQEDCRFNVLSRYLMDSGIIVRSRHHLVSSDSILSLYIGTAKSKKTPLTSFELQILIANYDSVLGELHSFRGLNATASKLLSRAIVNRGLLCRYLSLKKGQMFFRDSVMAENALWMQREILGDQKIVLWSTNLHVAKRGSGNQRWMGERIGWNLNEAYGSVAFFNKGRPAKAVRFGDVYVSAEKERFDISIYTESKEKVKPENWITPCDY